MEVHPTKKPPKAAKRVILIMLERAMYLADYPALPLQPTGAAIAALDTRVNIARL